MAKKLKQFIERLQRSNDETKRKWLIGLSASTMLVVVALWIGYMRLTIGGTDTNTQTKETGDSRRSAFVSIMKQGAAIIANQIFSFTRTQVMTEHELSIKNGPHTFQLKDLTPITPKNLDE